MATIDLAEIFEPVERHGMVFIRARHNLTESPRLKAYRKCVGDMTRGHHYRTGDAATDEAEVRTAFRQAAHECAGQTGPAGGALERREPSRMSVDRAQRLLEAAALSIDSCRERGRIGDTAAETRRRNVQALRGEVQAAAEGGFVPPAVGRRVEQGAAFAGLCPRGGR